MLSSRLQKRGGKALESRSLFWQFVLDRKKQYIAGIAILSIPCVLQLVIPKLLEQFTDRLQLMHISTADLLVLSGWIVVTGLGVALFRALCRIHLFRLARQLELDVRRRLFVQWQSLSADYYGKQRIGDLMAHAINDVNVLREVGMQCVFMMSEATILTVAALVAMGGTVDLGLTLLVMLPLPGLTYLVYRFRGIIQRRSTKVQEAIAQMTSRVQEFCSGIRVIKAYVQEKAEMRKFTDDNRNNLETNQTLIQANSMFVSASQAIVGVSYLLSVVFGGLLVMEERISLGQFVAFNTYLTLIIPQIENFGKVINTLQRGKAADIRLQRILDMKPTVKDEQDVIPLQHIRGQIDIAHLTFRYPGSKEPILENVSLSVPAGSSLAIVGKVGSGKTTLIHLLLRMFNPPRGTMYIDGTDIRRIPLRTLRRSIGFVPQEQFLFSSTIGENIAFDPEPYSERDVEEAARIAQVYDNIVEFPKRFATPLGERGVSLSGGQRQRVSIARALIKQPEILIFDDSLSAVDAETEEKILQGLKEVMRGRTTIIVSHRISAIRHADQIIVMDGGSIVERGDHDSLLRQGGMYASMYAQQTTNKVWGE